MYKITISQVSTAVTVKLAPFCMFMLVHLAFSFPTYRVCMKYTLRIAFNNPLILLVELWMSPVLPYIQDGNYFCDEMFLDSTRV